MKSISTAVLTSLTALLCASLASAQQLTDFRDEDAISAVRVLRGEAIRPAGPPKSPTKTARRVVAGERLWLIDDRAGEVVACRLRKTSTVGKSAVRCFKGDLPASIRTD